MLFTSCRMKLSRDETASRTVRLLCGLRRFSSVSLYPRNMKTPCGMVYVSGSRNTFKVSHRRQATCRRCLKLTWKWSHADKASTVAKTATPVRLVGRCSVIVKREVSLAGRRLHANCVAHEHLALAALAELGAFGLVISVELRIRN